MAELCEFSVAGEFPPGMGFGDIAELMAGHVGPVKWNWFVVHCVVIRIFGGEKNDTQNVSVEIVRTGQTTSFDNLVSGSWLRKLAGIISTSSSSCS